MSNKNNETMDGVFTGPTAEKQSPNAEKRPANAEKPARPPRQKISLTRETKVGLAVVGALLIIFVVVLAIRLAGGPEDELSDNSSSSETASNTVKPENKAGVSPGSTILPAKSTAKSQYWDGSAKSKSATPRSTSVYASDASQSATADPRAGAPQFLPGGTAAHSKAASPAGAAITADDGDTQDPRWPYGATTAQANSEQPPRGSAFSQNSSDPFADRSHLLTAPSAFASDDAASATNEADETPALPTQPSAAAVSDLNTDRELPSRGPSFQRFAADKLQDESKSSNPQEPLNPFERGLPNTNRAQVKASAAAADDEPQLDDNAVDLAADRAMASQPSRTNNDRSTNGAKLLPAKEFDLQPAPRVASSKESSGGERATSEAPLFAGQRKPAAAAPLEEPAANDEPPVAARDNRGAPAHRESYTVAPNDTYWTIAQKTYGAGAYFKALYEHNRRRLDDAEQLRAGMQLSVPDEATLQQLYPTLCPKPNRVATAARATRASAESPATGAYVVKDGDTLYEIARRQLGRSSRWAEVYELNRDAIGEATDRLVPGTRLELPNATDETRSTTGVRVRSNGFEKR